MAYSTNEIYEQALKVIEANPKVVFINQLITKIGISKPTFYKHFPKNSDEFNSIREAMRGNREGVKEKLRDNWQKDTASAALQINLYRLLADEEELERLNSNALPPNKEEQKVIRIENYTPLKGGRNDIN